MNIDLLVFHQLNVMLYHGRGYITWCAEAVAVLSAVGGGVTENPCYSGRHGCDTNAMCHAGEGTQFTCECAAGFTGDGRACDGISSDTLPNELL